MIQCLNDYVLSYALSSSFSIPLHWLSMATSTTFYHNDIDKIAFQMESKGTNKFLKKWFTYILQLLATCLFEEPTSASVFYMLNEMGV